MEPSTARYDTVLPALQIGTHSLIFTLKLGSYGDRLCTRGETEAQKEEATSSRSSFEPRQPDSKIWTLYIFTVLTVPLRGINSPNEGLPRVAQWLRLRTPNAGGPGSIPDPGARSHMLQ